MSVHELHELSNYSVRQLNRYISDGLIKASRTPNGKKYQIPRAEADAFLAKLRASADIREKHTSAGQQALLELWENYTET